MPIRAALTLLPDIADSLALTDLAGLQLADAASVAAMHHPPLNPDVPALLVNPADLPALQRVLLNQYPPEHTLQLVLHDDQGPLATQPVTLSAVGTQNAEGAVAVLVPALPIASSMERFQETIAHLRAPEGCPWDRKQTHQSLRPYLLEETYEVLDALDSGDAEALREELGDLLLQIVLHSQIAVDDAEFRMSDVIAGINSKIIHRHPHVWGEVQVSGDEDVKANWDKIKQAEKNHEGT
ncbi:MAG: MazG family protein, partial [Chloroflexi bacterium]|nr:MazG family protein [Chloroflexota bacterium]